jgi:hypothetical protein
MVGTTATGDDNGEAPTTTAASNGGEECKAKEATQEK